MIASMLSMTPGDIKKAAIRDPYSVHKAVYSLFPGSERTFLYHDHGGDRWQRRVLILSEEHPLAPKFGVIESKAIPDRFFGFTKYAFQVRVNPVKTISSTGKRVAITDRDELLAWFAERASGWGFQVGKDTFVLDKTGVQTIDKGQKTITHNVAEYRGVLTVTDREKFRQTFASGIGKAKAFGFGLLQIRPVG